jgi:amino acid adenylation domain-containing protein
MAAGAGNSVISIRELVDRAARTQPDAPFLIGPETQRTLTFQALRQELSALTTQLRQAGLERGDKVAFLMDNGLSSAELFLAAMYGGFVSVPLNVRAGVSQLSYMLDHCDAKVVFVDNTYDDLAKAAMSGVRRAMKTIPAEADRFPELRETTAPQTLPPLSPDDEALLMYTSGSVGQPKAAVHTHRSLLAQARNSVLSHQLSSSDRSLLVLPLYHINAECVTLIPTLLSGGSVVVPHHFSVSQFWDLLDEYHCTWSAVVPTIVSQLLDWKDPLEDRRQAAFARIRFLRSSSAPLSPAQHREFLDKFDLLLIQAMGSSEAGNIFSNPLSAGENKIGSPGLAWGFDTRVVNREGADVTPGEAGEVLIRGEAMMRGYYKDAEGTAAVLDGDGWLHTGDLAYQDDDGYFFVVGRSKELVIKGGVNIAPRQIDDVLEAHPAVLEAAAVGVPDRYLGEDLVAFVVLRDGVTCNEGELLSFCEGRLGLFKTPTRIYFAADLPKGPSGKVQRLRLRDKATQPAMAVLGMSGSELAVPEGTGQVIHNHLADPTAFLERVIAETWAEVLPQRSIEPNDNFFALGGHSLLAVRCVSRLRERISVALSLSDFFENATVERQAALVRRRLKPDNSSTGQAQGDRPLQPLAEARQDLSSSVTPVMIPPRDRTVPYPLSPSQRRLWFMQRLNPELPVYNEAEAVRLRGELNVEAMERALNTIVARHEILRTTIRTVGEEPVGVVLEHWPLQIKKIDLSRLPTPERQAEVDRLLIQEPAQLYRLETEPGIRVTLLRLAPREHILILMMHHIICDWSSEGVFWRELSVLYRSFSRGEPFALPPPAIQHGDYAAWQVQQNADATFIEDLAFWEDNLRGAPQLLELPTDRTRPPTSSYRGARQRVYLNATLTQALRDLGQRTERTLFTVFAAALSTLLYRYSGQENILLGIPIADRDRKELESLMGFLLHTQVLRSELSADMTFRELLAQVQHGVLGLYLHRSVPFEQVVRRLRPERNLSYSPLFQAMINFRDSNELLSFIGLEGLEVETAFAESGASKFDLTLFVTDCRDEVWLEWEYCTDLFDDVRIARMLGHFKTLLESVACDPDQRLSQVPLLTDAERGDILASWNHTEIAYPENGCIHELFERKAEQTPEAVAVESGDQRLSYRELNRRSNRVAHRLRQLGVKPDDLVGICMDRSLELAVGLLAILKAGAAYLPLDPAYPKARLDFILEDAQADVVLTQERLRKLLSAKRGRVVYLDTEWDEIAQCEPTNPVNILDPGHLAYAIYTSGSTGNPKGVAICHRAVINFLNSMRVAPGMGPHDTMLSVTTVSFDIFGLEIWLPLTIGARVVIASEEAARDARKLAALMRQSTVMQATPYTWRLLLESGWQGNANLKILCGGEAWPEELAAQLLPKCASLWNMYGPTETTIWSAVYAVEKDRPVLIGHPIANTQFYVVDSHLQPVPIGVPGELLIGGAGLASGYLNLPQLTAEKFIADPFTPNAGSRLYRTGDLVRYLADGSLEFLGRIDQQVKIRGFRIELEEIESVLRTHACVREAAVITREQDGEAQLVAYIVPCGLHTPTVAELRAHARQQLPDYMVPEACVFLPAFPLTPNGKLNRKALPSPSRTALQVNSTSGAPRDLLEQQLIRSWEKILRVHPVGRNDNFFELGGHSFAAVRLLSEIKAVTGRDLPLAILFQASTVADLAEILRKDDWMPSWSSLVPIQPAGSKPPLFLVHGAEGNVLLYRRLATHLGSDQPVYGLQSQGLNGRGPFQSHIEEMASHYVRELRALDPTGPYMLGGYCMGGTIALEMAQQLTAQGQEVALVVMIDSYNLNKISRKRLGRLAAVHLAQNFWFHAANFLSIRTGDRRSFVREKLDVARNRLKRRLGAAHDAIGSFAGKTPNPYSQFRLRQVNDRATMAYVPRPYRNRLVVVRCKGHFWKLDDPALGWGEIAGDNLEIQSFPIYRKGILVEPFVRTLAEGLKRCLGDSQKDSAIAEDRPAGVASHMQVAG